MQFLRQNTNINVKIGPILTPAGAVYPSAVIADISLDKNAVTSVLADPTTLVHAYNGIYTLGLKAANVDTIGMLDIGCNKADYAMPMKSFEVLNTKIFDAFVTGEIVTGTTLVFESPVVDGRVTILKGDLYSAATTAKIEFINEDWNWSTESFIFTSSQGLSFPMVVVNATTLRLDLTPEESGQFESGNFDYKIRSTTSFTIAYGELIVLTQFGRV